MKLRRVWIVMIHAKCFGLSISCLYTKCHFTSSILASYQMMATTGRNINGEGQWLYIANVIPMYLYPLWSQSDLFSTH